MIVFLKASLVVTLVALMLTLFSTLIFICAAVFSKPFTKPSIYALSRFFKHGFEISFGFFLRLWVMVVTMLFAYYSSITLYQLIF